MILQRGKKVEIEEKTKRKAKKVLLNYRLFKKVLFLFNRLMDQWTRKKRFHQTEKKLSYWHCNPLFSNPFKLIITFLITFLPFKIGRKKTNLIFNCSSAIIPLSSAHQLKFDFSRRGFLCFSIAVKQKFVNRNEVNYVV